MPKESVSILSYSQDSCPIPQFSPIRAVFQLGILFFLPLPQPGRAGWSWSSADFVKRPRLLAGEGRGNIWKENKSGLGWGWKKAIFGRVHQAGVACPGPLCANLVLWAGPSVGPGPTAAVVWWLQVKQGNRGPGPPASPGPRLTAPRCCAAPRERGKMKSNVGCFSYYSFSACVCERESVCHNLASI